MDPSDRPSITIGFASSADVSGIVDIMREGAAWMAAKNCPAWEESALTPAMVAPFVERSEFIAARDGFELAGVCTLTRLDMDFWPEDPPGFAAYIHKLAIRRAYAGGVVTTHLVEHCLGMARGWACQALRLDCHPVLHGVYAKLGFSYVDNRSVHLSDGRTLVVDRFEILI